jgi:uncharacterized protein
MRFTLTILLLTLTTPVLAAEKGAGTEGRAWLSQSDTPVSLLPKTNEPLPVRELVDATSLLSLDPVTGVWGIPVPRLGDPDYGPDNINYTGKIPDAPLTLPARIFVPNGKLDRSRPCILMTNGYGVDDRAPENSPKDGRLIEQMAAQDYTAIVVALRQSSSDPQSRQIGINGYYSHYGEDGVAIINDIVRRYGCAMEKDDPKTGKVGMVGASLLGGSQWAVVAQPDYPPALRAIAPDSAGITHSSYATLWYPGGMLPGPLRITRPGRELGSIYPSHRDYDAFWAERQISSGQLRAVASRRLALLMTGGWDEYNTPGNIDSYSAFRALSGPTNKRMIISPTGHTMPAALYRPLVIDWMDRWLKGTVRQDEQPAVSLYVRGAEQWRAEQAWPIPDTKIFTLGLSPRRSGSITSRNDGSLVTGSAGSGPAARYDYDPDTGPFLRVMVSQSVQGDNSLRLTGDMTPEEAQVVTWTSAALSQASEITGSPVLTFWATSSASDADFVVSLTQVSPDGKSRQIVQGYLNGPRQGYASVDPVIAPPIPLVPGQPRQFTIRLAPTATVVPAGFRLRLSIAGGAEIGVGNDGKPQRQPQGPGKNDKPFSIEVLQSGKHPATLTLPIIGTNPVFSRQ